MAATSGIGRRRSAAQNGKDNTAYQQRRQEIFEAAGHVFKQKGFEGTSLSDIAAHLGTDRANLYYYVGSKEELLDGAVTQAVLLNVESAKAVRDSDLSAPEKLRRLVVDLMTSYETNYPFLYVFIQEDLNRVGKGKSKWALKMKQVNRQYEQLVVSIVEEGFEDGSLRRTAPAWVVAYGIIGLVGWTNRWYDPARVRDGADGAAIGAAYADMVINGLAADVADEAG